jgi:hypothetical protein
MQKMTFRRPVRIPLISALAGAGVLVAVTAGVLVARDDGNTTTLAAQPAAQVSSLQQGCQRWLTQDSTRGQTTTWCTGLAGWMSEHMATTGMGPQMMWGGPEQVRSTCRQWVTAEPSKTDSVNGADWCDSMVDWMGTHMGNWSGRGDWNDWMMHGPMMGH